MPQTNRLTATQVRAAKHDGRDYKLTDGGGMYLHVTAHGKYWRLRYRRNGKETTLGLGVYPEISLAQAREARDEAKRAIRQGLNPRVQPHQVEDEHTVQSVAQDWIRSRGWTETYRRRIEGRLALHVFPWIGSRPIGEVTAPELLEVIRRAERAGTVETAHRCRQHMNGVYTFAMAAGLVMHNPAAGIEVAMASRPPDRHFAAITDPDELGALLRAMEGYPGTPQVCTALRLTPLLLARPGELRHMEWAEVDLEAATWTIAAAKMKMRRDHVVPLARQAVEALEYLARFTGRRRYVFEGRRDRPMSENTVLVALRSLGYDRDQVTAHGFRATARTLLDEVLGWRPDIIEHQLAHAVRDPTGRAYNRTTFLAERREMMQAWADYLDGLRQPSYPSTV